MGQGAAMESSFEVAWTVSMGPGWMLVGANVEVQRLCMVCTSTVGPSPFSRDLSHRDAMMRSVAGIAASVKRSVADVWWKPSSNWSRGAHASCPISGWSMNPAMARPTVTNDGVPIPSNAVAAASEASTSHLDGYACYWRP